MFVTSWAKFTRGRRNIILMLVFAGTTRRADTCYWYKSFSCCTRQTSCRSLFNRIIPSSTRRTRGRRNIILMLVFAGSTRWAGTCCWYKLLSCGTSRTRPWRSCCINIITSRTNFATCLLMIVLVLIISIWTIVAFVKHFIYPFFTGTTFAQPTTLYRSIWIWFCFDECVCRVPWYNYIVPRFSIFINPFRNQCPRTRIRAPIRIFFNWWNDSVCRIFFNILPVRHRKSWNQKHHKQRQHEPF